MAALLIVFSLAVLSSLQADLSGDCTKLSVEQCAQVAACLIKDSACAADPCIERTLTALDVCNNGPNCVKYDTNVESMCVSSDRKASITNVCSLEWGNTYYVEEGLCQTLTGCQGVTAIEVLGGKYYVCNVKPTPTDPCNSLTEEICPYIGKCMWEGGQCVADTCWEKTYTSKDKCETNCTPYQITDTPALLGYCKNGTHNLQSKCNAGTGSNVLTKQVACSGYPDPCNKIATINNYEGGTLYVCNDVDIELTVPDAAFSVRISALALFVIALLAFSL